MYLRCVNEDQWKLFTPKNSKYILFLERKAEVRSTMTTSKESIQ